MSGDSVEEIAPVEVQNWAFKIFVCGARGGMYNSDVTSYFIAPYGQPHHWLSLDAGANFDCIHKYLSMYPTDTILLDPNYVRVANQLNAEGYFRQKQLIGFAVTHAHLDHLEGLIVSSADEEYQARKPVFGLGPINQNVARVFTIPSWPGNFGWYIYVQCNHVPFALTGTQARVQHANGDHYDYAHNPMSISAFPLDHGGEMSTAFLVTAHGRSVLFFGDTMPDGIKYFNTEAERATTPMSNLWGHAAINSKLRDGTLRTILIECSYPDPRPDNLLFGHLTPKYLAAELVNLMKARNTMATVEMDLDIIVTHIKPTLKLKDNTVPVAVDVGGAIPEDTVETSNTIDTIMKQLHDQANKQTRAAFAGKREWNIAYKYMTWKFHRPNQGDIFWVPMAKYDVTKKDPVKALKKLGINDDRANGPIIAPDYHHGGEHNARPYGPGGYYPHPQVPQPNSGYPPDGDMPRSYPHGGDFMRYVYPPEYNYAAQAAQAAQQTWMYTEMAVLALLVVAIVCLCGMVLGWAAKEAASWFQDQKMKRDKNEN